MLQLKGVLRDMETKCNGKTFWNRGKILGKK